MCDFVVYSQAFAIIMWLWDLYSSHIKQWKINEFIERDEEAGSKCTFFINGLSGQRPPVFTLQFVLVNASVSLIQQIATRKKQSNRTVLLIIFSRGKNTAEDLRG